MLKALDSWPDNGGGPDKVPAFGGNSGSQNRGKCREWQRWGWGESSWGWSSEKSPRAGHSQRGDKGLELTERREEQKTSLQVTGER